MTIAIVVGNPTPQSRTLHAARLLVDRLAGRSADVEIDLVTLGAGLLDPRAADVATAVAAVRSAGLVVAASPTYKATYTGLLKLFLDRFGAGSLAGVVVVPLMLGAGERHALAAEAFLKPVLAELGASTPTRALFLLESQHADPAPIDHWLATARQQLPGDLGYARPTPSTVDTQDFRRVLGAFPTGVTAIAALFDGTPVGIAANSFTSVSLEPPLVSVCVAHTSTTWPALRGATRLGLSVLSADQERAGRQLAARSGDRFHDLQWNASPDGAVFLEQACAWLDCSVERLIRAGDHDLVLLRVHALGHDPGVAPLVFHGSRFRRLEEQAWSAEAMADRR